MPPKKNRKNQGGSMNRKYLMGKHIENFIIFPVWLITISIPFLFAPTIMSLWILKQFGTNDILALSLSLSIFLYLYVQWYYPAIKMVKNEINNSY
ncbi:MAG: hypothetical protein D6732_02870 [Methanobacteriota archaeon]|nr:MAG: hypothetical protein D6732_02870 [Euryarchaeota archaeon]